MYHATRNKSTSIRSCTQQAAVSKLEHRTDTTVSTLRQTIEAMGGKLELFAHFPDNTVVQITQFG